MAIAPADGQAFAKAVRAVYDEAERLILEKIANRVAKGGEESDPNHWLERKLNEVQRARTEIDRVLATINKQGPKAVQDLILHAYINGLSSADSDLTDAGQALPSEIPPLEVPTDTLVDPASIVAGFGTIHTEAINSLVAATMGGLQGAHVQMVRSARDAYKDVITEIAASAVAGVETRQQATKRALNKFADKGIGRFTDKAGKEWDIATYAEMATRTGMAHAHIQGHINRLVERGRDLVIVSSHREPSDLCQPHQGKIYSISGKHPKYKSLAWAIADGLFHPNCRHTINAYIEGLTEETPDAGGDPDGYKQRQKQRYMERQVRGWKKRAAVATTPADRAKSEAKIKEWQEKLRKFTKETGRKRMYAREGIDTRLITKGPIAAGEVPDGLDPAARVISLDDITKTAVTETTDAIAEAAEISGPTIRGKAPSKFTVADRESIAATSDWHAAIIEATGDMSKGDARILWSYANKNVPFDEWTNESKDVFLQHVDPSKRSLFGLADIKITKEEEEPVEIQIPEIETPVEVEAPVEIESRDVIVSDGLSFDDLESVAKIKDADGYAKFSAAAGERAASGTGSDDLLVEIAEAQKFDTKPQVLSSDDFEKILANGGIDMYRGVTSKDLAEQLYDGEYFGGKGTYGSGYYFAIQDSAKRTSSGRDIALSYADGKEEGVVRAALRPDAKVIEHADAERLRQEAIRDIDQRMMGAWGDQELMYKLQAQKLTFADVGRWAAFSGYDAIKTSDSEDYLIVFNRSAIVVAKPTTAKAEVKTKTKDLSSVSPSDDLLDIAKDTRSIDDIMMWLDESDPVVAELQEIIGIVGSEEAAYEWLMEKVRWENLSPREREAELEQQRRLSNATGWEKENFPLGPTYDAIEHRKHWAQIDSKPHAKKHGYDSLDEYFAATKKHVGKLLKDATPTVRVSPTVLGIIVNNDGRFKSQFETGSSNGSFAPSTRAKVEYDSFGAPKDMDPKDRPIYGLLDTKYGTTQQGIWYGSVKARLKMDNIKDRMTMTVGDSLDEGALGLKLNDPDTTLVGTDILAAKDITQLHGSSYTEIQVFGGLTLDDIERIDVIKRDTGDLGVRNTLDKLESMGVEVRVYENKGLNSNEKASYTTWHDYKNE